jgi:hypothetical protein
MFVDMILFEEKRFKYINNEWIRSDRLELEDDDEEQEKRWLFLRLLPKLF